MIWLIGFGGSLGAGARYLLGIYINNKTRNWIIFPLGTWVINISGSFILGVIAHMYSDNLISEWVWLFGGIGFCGAYTTFSTFGYETISLIERKNFKIAFIYVTSSVIIGIISSAIGFMIS